MNTNMIVNDSEQEPMEKKLKRDTRPAKPKRAHLRLSSLLADELRGKPIQFRRKIPPDTPLFHPLPSPLPHPTQGTSVQALRSLRSFSRFLCSL